MTVPATQAQIARRVGISQQAVSYVLGNHSSRSRIRVRPEVRRKVLRVARRLGYRPNRLAQAVRKRRSGLIGVFSFHGASEVGARRTFFAAKCIREAGYHLLATDAAWYARGVEDALHAMLDARVEGILIATPPEWFSVSLVRRTRDMGVPMVGLSGASLYGVPQVRADVRQGMALLVRHLLELGHRHLVLAMRLRSSSRSSANWTMRERLEGFRDAVREFRLRAPTALHPEPVASVLEVPPPADAWPSYQCGVEALRAVLKGGDAPDVLLCSNDDWAVGALRACVDRGLSVPDEMAVTGFDGTSAGAFCTPRLTSVLQPVEEMARRGVDLLLRQIGGEKLPPSERLLKLPCVLMVRESCGTPACDRPIVAESKPPLSPSLNLQTSSAVSL
ncbi:MAG: LacI family DNA-binding transcriptional regulator [Verrucomicrobiae bacterium]|nr:LacI family DNA-binding transcriptional regulator [Verrucomicrobiae bacterium]